VLASLPCGRLHADGDASPPSPEQLQAQVRTEEEAHRTFVDQLEARLSSQANQAATPDRERQLTNSLEMNLAGTKAKLREITCGADLCKVEIGGVEAVEANAVLAALATTHACAMPLIDLPETGTDTIISAYVDCSAAQQ
jgi:hypothetical protein